MYRVYDEFEGCFYTLEETEKIKKDNPTAPPERWLFVTICDEMPNGLFARRGGADSRMSMLC